MVDKESDRQVPYAEAKEYADKRGMEYIEVSTKMGRNTKKLLEKIVMIGQTTILYNQPEHVPKRDKRVE
jgi:hypothetical protein